MSLNKIFGDDYDDDDNTGISGTSTSNQTIQFVNSPGSSLEENMCFRNTFRSMKSLLIISACSLV